MKTARYANTMISNDKHTPVQISLGLPKFEISYRISSSLSILFPTYPMLSLGDESVYREKYIQLLNQRGLGVILAEMHKVAVPGKETILLCFEDLRKPGTWCHRRMFAEWLQSKTGKVIEELEEPRQQTLLFD